MNMLIEYLKESIMLSRRGKDNVVNYNCSFANSHNRKVRTPDMGGNNTTHQFTRSVLDHMEAAA